MGDVHYMISEAAKHVGVESHVLRYWEEELDLPIGRTEMGHRHYTEEDIQLFSCIKELKEQGLLLKEIKQLLPDMLRTKALLKARKSDAPKAAASINEVADPQDPALSVYTARQPFSFCLSASARRVSPKNSFGKQPDPGGVSRQIRI
ncbi:MAG: helix-turn-helix domain-containing protein [Coprococcus sp.]